MQGGERPVSHVPILAEVYAPDLLHLVPTGGTVGKALEGIQRQCHHVIHDELRNAVDNMMALALDTLNALH